jgi:hypothetical protein
MTTRNTRMTGFKKLITRKWSKMVLKTVILITVFVLLAPCSFAQTAGDTTRGFHDDLLDHMVGKWNVSANVYGQKFTLDREAEWVMDHQYLRIYEKSREIIPWLKVPFERTIFIGYNHRSKRYVVYELTVHGGDVPHEPEGFYYGDRTGNELKMSLTKGSEVVAYQRFIWEPASGSWRFQGTRLIDGKEQEPNVDQKAIRVTTSSK